MRVPSQVQQNYELFERIGVGGMGAVYRAQSRRDGRQLAVKLIDAKHLRHPQSRRAFVREAMSISRLRHPHVVELFDFGVDEENGGFLVTDYLGDGHLGQWRLGWPGWGSLLRAVQSVLSALAFAHARGIVHCDLKPENILLRDAQRGDASLADFGVAQLAVYRRSPSAEPSNWQTGELTGTPTYMAPEQAEGRLGMYGPWTDFYALGVVIFEIVSGAPPFDASSLPGLLLKHLREPAPPLAARPGVELLDGVGELLEQMLAKDPWARPRFAAELLRRFAALMPQASALDGVAQPTPRMTPAAASEASPRRITLVSSGHLPWRKVEHLTPSLRSLKLREPDLVGRRAEADSLQQTAMEVRSQSKAAVVLLEATAGMGKTRLAEGLREWAEGYGTMESWWCSYRSDAPAHAAGLRGALATYFLCPGLDRSQTEASLQARLSRSGVSDPWETRAFLEWLCPLPERQRDASLSSAVGLALRAASRASRRHPLLVVMDDLHHGDPSEALAFAERLLQDFGGHPVLLLLIYRSATRRDASVVEPRAVEADLGPALRGVEPWNPGREELVRRLAELRAHPMVHWLRLEAMLTSELECLLMKEIGLESSTAQRLARLSEGCPAEALQLARAALDVLSIQQPDESLGRRDADASSNAAPSLEASQGEAHGVLMLDTEEGKLERRRPRLSTPLASGRYLNEYVDDCLSRARSPHGTQTLAMAALLGPSVTRQTLLEALCICWPEGRWSDRLDELLEAFDEDELLSWTLEEDLVLLAHEPLMRLAVSTLVDAGWAAAAHAAAASALRRFLGIHHGPAAARCARHLAQAGCVWEAWAMMATAVDDAARRARYGEAVALCNELGSWLDGWADPPSSESRGWLLRSMAWAAFRCGALEQGRLQLSRELGRPCSEAAVLAERAQLQAEMALLEGDAAAAQRSFELARMGFETLGAHREAAESYLGLATALRMQTEFAAASRAAQLALSGFEAMGETRGVASSRRVLGQIALLESDFETSRQHYGEALALFEGMGDTHGVADSLRGLAGLEIESGQVEQAVAPLERASEAYEAIGDFVGLAHALRGLARVRRVRGQLDAARAELQRCIELFERLGVPLGAADAMVDLASALREQNQFDAAVELLQRACASYWSAGNERGVGCCLLVLGNVYLDAGRPELARQRQTEAVQLFERVQYGYGIRLARLNLGHAYLHEAALGQGEQAQHGLEQAAALLEAVRSEAGGSEGVLLALADAYLALLELRRGRFELAMACFARAIAQDELANAELGAAFERLGEELWQRNEGAEAIEALDAARAHYEGLGQHGMARRLSRRVSELKNVLSKSRREREP